MEIHSRSEEVLASADSHRDGAVRWFNRFDSRNRRVTLYLYNFLGYMRILGLSAFYHDSAAALLVDGDIIAAAQEERFSRHKHDSQFPRNATQYCLDEAGITMDQIDHFAFYDKPFLKFERLLETYTAVAPRGFQSFRQAMPLWLREKLFQKSLLTSELKAFAPNVDFASKLLFAEHHQSHAASAFFASPFAEAAVLTLDGVGEWATTSLAIGCGNNLKMIREMHFPHSLGLLYSAFTYYTGFRVNSGEYKVMGLAPYGTPIYRDRILDNLIDLKADGTFRLDMSYFDYCSGLRMTSKRFHDLFGAPPRNPNSLLDQRHMDLAASIQEVTEEVMLRLTRSIVKETGHNKLCLAGGVALNCVANGKIMRDGHVKELWIQPAAGDAGGALGAALCAYYGFKRQPRTIDSNSDSMQGSYLGPSFKQKDIEKRLSDSGARFTVVNDTNLIGQTVSALSEGKAVGWFQGRMEFGPRALGARSILGDARSPTMQKLLNLKIKYRESFRPFAPSILREDVGDWFELDSDSPYMLLVAKVNEEHRRQTTPEEDALFGIEKISVRRSSIPAITHVDYSARVQTVHLSTNPLYYNLIKNFKKQTGCPLIVNTSFNVRSEPIVCTPEDAFRCFMGTEIEYLSIGNCVLNKEEQDPALISDYKDNFEAD